MWSNKVLQTPKVKQNQKIYLQLLNPNHVQRDNLNIDMELILYEYIYYRYSRFKFF